MKDLDFYTRYAKSILDSLNIPYVDCPVSVNPRLKVWGKHWCTRGRNNTTYNHRIELNKVLVLDTTEDDALMDTLIHEYLHSCPNCQCHTGMWKYYANMVNEKYHYNIQRCTSYEEKGIEPAIANCNWEVSCPNCNHKWGFARKSNAVKGALANHEMGCPICNKYSRGWKVVHFG